VLISTPFHRRRKETESKVRELIAKVDAWPWIEEVLRSQSAEANICVGIVGSSVGRKRAGAGAERARRVAYY